MLRLGLRNRLESFSCVYSFCANCSCVVARRSGTRLHLETSKGLKNQKIARLTRKGCETRRFRATGKSWINWNVVATLNPKP
jgi:hypothetical protein